MKPENLKEARFEGFYSFIPRGGASKLYGSKFFIKDADTFSGKEPDLVVYQDYKNNSNWVLKEKLCYILKWHPYFNNVVDENHHLTWRVTYYLDREHGPIDEKTLLDVYMSRKRNRIIY